MRFVHLTPYLTAPKKNPRENFKAFRLDKRETPKSIEIANLNFPVSSLSRRAVEYLERGSRGGQEETIVSLLCMPIDSVVRTKLLRFGFFELGSRKELRGFEMQIFPAKPIGTQ